jgi:hypothetical protein
MTELSGFQRDLQRIETELRGLEHEYAKYFADRTPLPPLEKQRRLEGLIKRCERNQIGEAAVDRFRLSTLQARYVTFMQLWERALRAREEGRPGPFSRQRPERE